ncbi:hypothetical protein FOPE_08383 [Fonsecaea pedrosoi]|nr:hypothetical protein FOPE_08383 [Fonsecaea pedrosoi]
MPGPQTLAIPVSFETGSMRYKALEQALFVGAGRFIVGEGGLTVEYRISKVSKGLGPAGGEVGGSGDGDAGGEGASQED